MNQDTQRQENESAVKISANESSKMAESMPVDPGELNICLSCE